MEEVKLVFIGDNYYAESKSIMSPIYTEHGNRYDWGFVSRDLCQGKSITIRQANTIEHEYYKARLHELKKQQTPD